MTDRDTKEKRDQRSAEQLERDKEWYAAQRAEAREIAGRAGMVARTLIDELGGEPYDNLSKHGVEARISPFVEIPHVEAEDVRTRFGRIFVAYNVEQAPDRPRHRWFGRRAPQAQGAPETTITRVGLHYYSRPDNTAYEGRYGTVQWDGSLHGSVADANLTLGVLEALADVMEAGRSEDNAEPAATL